MKRNPNAIRMPHQDKIFIGIVNTLMILLAFVTLYPLVYVLSSSFSSPEAILAGKVILWPVDLSLEGFQRVFSYPAVMTGYANTLFYTIAGTVSSVFITLVCAYPLSRPKLPHRGFFMFLFTFTMYFGGGMIPGYLLLRDLHLLNTRAALIVPGMLSVYNMIITRTFFQSSIPEELFEAARVDGCNDTRFFFQILLPLSKAIIAVIALYYAVGYWNDWFGAFLYLNDPDLYPLQLVLRSILVSNTIDDSLIIDPETRMKMMGMAEMLKYSLIVVSTVPLLCIYPLVQKYFIRGVMIGSLKG